MTVLGNLAVIASLVTSLVSAFRYYRVAAANASSLRPARLWLRISVASICVASLALLALILRHDFANAYVYSYSSRSLPLHYLISSFYAGQEGSFLFWALCSGILALIVMRYSAQRKTECWVMTVVMGIQSFLLLLVVAKSPFRQVWEMYGNIPVGQTPPDGRGLNPLLQNLWMVVHPPVLFLGFAGMAIPFSYAIAALWKKHYSLLSEQGIPWILFATLVLGLGIMLGAYWAYGVLGWGGYWGWDPVENSSLIPWITGIALLHTMLAQRRSMKYLKTNVLLAILSFVLVLFSTFLTRSGILGDASVHSFVDPGASVYWLLIAFMTGVAALGAGMVYIRRADLVAPKTEVVIFNRESALGAGAVVLLLSALVILFGTSLPIFSTMRVEPSFYDSTNIPVVIVMGLLIGFSLCVQWRMDDGKHMLRRAWKSLAASSFISAALFALGVHNTIVLSFVFSLAFALVVNLEVGVKIARGDPRFLGGKFAHIGVAVLLLGVIASGKYSSTQHLVLPLNIPQEALGQRLTYVGYRATEDGKFAFDVVAEKQGRKYRLSPVMFDAGEQGLMRNPDIASSLTGDFYISPVSLDQAGGNAADGHEDYTLLRGQPVTIGTVKTTFVRFDMGAHDAGAMNNGEGGMAVGSVLELSDGSSRETIVPMTVYRSDGPPTYSSPPSKLIRGNIQLVSMNVGMGSTQSSVTLRVERSVPAARAEALVVEASVKPYISLVWVGTVVLIIGFVLSLFKRSREP
jgi:cytochrome c-type biogenesis protein CcmF